MVAGIPGGYSQFAAGIAQQDTRLINTGELDAFVLHRLGKFPRCSIRILIRMDVARTAGAIPSPLAIVVFAPRLPIEIQNESVNGNSFRAVSIDNLCNF